MRLKQTLLGISVASALLAMSGNASASAFALIEQSSGTGNAYAGGAAAAEDASTIFFNPAGMSRLNGNQVTVAGSFIQPSAKFRDTGSTGAALQTAGGNGGDAGSLALVPNTYIVTEIQPVLRFGLGINAPFGLQTKYDPTWIGRFQAITSKIQTINLNPSLAYQMSDTVSLGIGLNYQHISGELSSAVNYSAAAFSAGGGALLTAVGGPGVEGITTMTGNDSAWGYNLGVLIDVMPNARIGLSYRSKLKYNLKGTVSFTSVPTALAASPTLQNGDVNLPITMPDTFSISGFHQLNDKWDMMADATWTGWSKLQQLVVTRTNGAVVQNIPENWKDTWRVAVGSTYHYNEQWLSRIGLAYDQTPVPDAYRTARIPDSNRTWVTFGGQYKVSVASKVDFAYAHLFMKDAPIANNQAATGAGILVGSYSNSVDILSVQYAYSF
ncbi:OmpP1/FadL family transporter [Sideroxydans lithotrophicus]|uniref:Membrane protein involved in aromatic hydrocarbon degradation n=1 Tax=Sideroxydans lithotrophicus (strain ES-1) TaxID=580332 RepID=D5CT00_SIDLE|nr:outer membrane protein transport protein [Sideroxydans lithotrophicus]ADE12086.1 membrane protein involved in aromatic hydrocarbon degradation [Sideroxydans lithotrophicus ES-1]